MEPRQAKVHSVRARAPRLLVSATALALLLAAGSPEAQQPPRSALFNPQTMRRAAELRPGMRGIGKTVFQGTQVEQFDVTVLAVLETENFAGDVILIHLDSGPCVEKGYGVIAGMSGSPIYVEGRLIGALAYGWGFAKEPIAGVQPIEQMLEAVQPTPMPVQRPELVLRPRGGAFQVGGESYAQVVLRNTAAPALFVVPPSGGPFAAGAGPSIASRYPGTGTLVPVSTPLMVSGMHTRARQRLQTFLEPYGIVPLAGPGRSSSGEPFKLEPGAAVGVQLARGDLEMTAVGTLTCVVGDTVLAFGHPFLGRGPISLPLVGAMVHGVLPAQDMSFKFASSLDPIGVATQDREWALGGTLGRTADLLPTAVAVTDLDRQVRREFHVEVARHRLLTPILSSIAAESALNLLVPADSQRTTYADFTAEIEGLPPIRRRNLFSSMPGGDGGGGGMLSFFSLSQEGPTDAVAQLLSLALDNRFGEKRVERIRLALAGSETRQAATLKRVSADQLTARPGDTINLTAVLETAAGESTSVSLPVRIPATTPAGVIRLAVCGGGSFAMLRQRYGLGEPPPATFQQLVQQWEAERPNNLVLAALAMPTVGLVVEGFRLPTLPTPVLEALRRSCPGEIGYARDGLEVSKATELAVEGRRYLSVRIETDEPEKGGRAAISRYGATDSYDEYGDEGGYAGADRGEYDQSAGALKQWVSWRPPWYELAANAIEFPEEKVDTESPPALPTAEELEASEQELPETSTGTATKSSASVGRGPGIWVTDTEKEFSQGKAVSTQIGSKGFVRPAPESVTLPQLGNTCYWAATTDAAGNLLVGTWPDGKVWQVPLRTDAVRPQGQPTVVLETKEPAITCLRRGRGGTVWAAAAPSGRLFRIEGGSAKEFARVPAPYVWGLCELDDGSLLAATGPEGKLFRVGADGKAELLHTFADRHVIALTRSKAGVFCATYPKGKVYRLDDPKAPVSLFEAPKVAVQCLAADDAGNVFVGTSPRAYVYRLDAAGQSKELYHGRSRHVFDLIPDGEGGVFAAMSVRGVLMHLTADGQEWRLTDTPTVDYLALAKAEADEVVATTLGSGLRRLLHSPAQRQAYESGVRDAGVTARWGLIRWYGETPGKSRLLMQTRSGNTAFPDDTWSPWSTMYAADFGQQIDSPAARCIQYRALFVAAPDSPPPTLDRVELFYLTANRPPVLEMKAPHAGEVWSGAAKVRWSASDPDKDKLAFTVSYQQAGQPEWTEIPSKKEAAGRKTGDLDVAPLSPTEEPQTPEAEPKAADGEAQSEKPSVEEPKQKDEPPRPEPGRGDGGKGDHAKEPGSSDEFAQWDEDLAAEEDAADTEGLDSWDLGPRSGSPQSRDWDTSKLPEGTYRVKVVASDEERNPGEGKTAEVVSPPFLVDNSPPRIDLPALGNARPQALTVEVRDSGCYVAGAEYRVDGGDWIAAAATDRVFDSQIEQIELNPTKLPDGKHRLEVHARDAAGNLGTAEAEYEWPERQARRLVPAVLALLRQLRTWFTARG
jgi:hypothetical protein